MKMFKKHSVENDEYRKKFDELITNPNAEKIVDVLKILETIAKLNGITLDDIKKIKLEKK